MIVPPCGLVSLRPTRCDASRPFSHITLRTQQGLVRTPGKRNRAHNQRLRARGPRYDCGDEGCFSSPTMLPTRAHVLACRSGHLMVSSSASRICSMLLGSERVAAGLAPFKWVCRVMSYAHRRPPSDTQWRHCGPRPSRFQRGPAERRSVHPRADQANQG